MSRHVPRALRIAVALTCLPSVFRAQSNAAPDSASGSARWHAYLLGTQVNVITQHLDPLRARYSGPNSLVSSGDTKTSHAYGVYAGVQAWPGLEGYLDAEMIRGFGISHATGLAGVTNGDVIRQGTVDLGSGPYVARAFVRYTFAFGQRAVDTLGRSPDQVPSLVSAQRLEVQAGKFALTDLFDVNRYANSTRWQFMNWALFNNSAWDYAADTRGYSNGVVVSWIHSRWTLRVGSMQMPTQANGNRFDSDLANARGDNAELTLAPSAGSVIRLLAFWNHGRMGNYNEALLSARLTGTAPNIVADDRPGRTKYGFGVNAEQAIGDGGETGAWLRLGWSDGNNESFVFTEVDREASGGVQISGTHWNRRDDRFALGLFDNDIGRPHQAYLAAGGLGFLLGDGGLTYGRELGLESFYRTRLGQYVQVSPDLQLVRNPGYNRDRGPATVWGVRFNLRY